MALHITMHQDSKKDHEMNSDYARLTYDQTPTTIPFAAGLKQKPKKKLKISKLLKSCCNTPPIYLHLSWTRSQLEDRRACNNDLKVSWEELGLTWILKAPPHQLVSRLRNWPWSYYRNLKAHSRSHTSYQTPCTRSQNMTPKWVMIPQGRLSSTYLLSSPLYQALEYHLQVNSDSLT